MEFDTFLSNFQKMLGDIHSFNPDFSIILGDFNAGSNNWWIGDTQKSNHESVLSQLLIALEN